MRALYICSMEGNSPQFPVNVQEQDENAKGGYAVKYEFLDADGNKKAVVQVDTTEANHAAMGANITLDGFKDKFVETVEPIAVEGIEFLSIVNNEGPL